MSWLSRILASLLVVDLALLIAWIAIRLKCNPALFNPAETTSLIALAGVLIALITWLFNQRREVALFGPKGLGELLEEVEQIQAKNKGAHQLTNN